MSSDMSFREMLEECKGIYPLLIWGDVDKKTHSIIHSSISLIDNQESFHIAKMDEFDEHVDRIWNQKNRKIWLWTRESIINYLEKVLRNIHNYGYDATNDNQKLCGEWENLISKASISYTVVHPIFGIYPVSNVISIEPFKIYNIRLHKDKLIEDSAIPEFKFGRISSDFQEADNYISYSIQANEPHRAMELARPWLELFECIAKFCLLDNNDYDIGMFNYKERGSEAGYVLSQDGQSSSFSSTGVFNKISMEMLIDQSKPVWNLLQKYSNGRCTEIEKRVIQSIRWIGLANHNEYEPIKCVQYIFALETLLSYHPEGEMITPSIASRLADSAAQIIGENANTQYISKKDLKKRVQKNVKRIYSNRSKIVHGGADSVPVDDVYLSRTIVYTLIQSLLSSNELMQMTSMRQLNEWLTDKNFS